MAKSDGIPIAGRDNDNDNPFYDQTAFSPPQIHHMLDQLRAGKGVGTKHADLVEGRERSASQPPPINLRDPLVADALFPTPPPTRLEAPSHFRLPDERGNSQPNLPTTGLASPPTTLPGADLQQQQQQLQQQQQQQPPPFDRAFSTPIRNAVEAEGLRGFHSAPVTPCQTPLGSRQGSPKAERRGAGGLLGAIFGSGIYGRQTSEGAKPGLLGHLAEDNEDDVTPVGSPGVFTADQLQTRLRGVEDGEQSDLLRMSRDFAGGGGGGDGGGVGGVAAPFVANTRKKKEKPAEIDYSYRELTIITPSSM